MNYGTLVKGAVALSLSLIVASASAATTTYNDVQKYGATFEDAIVADQNDHVYTNNMPITDSTLRDEVNEVGWFSGDAESDESKIIERTDAAGGQALQLNTDASTLTNKFGSTLAGNLNDGIAAAGAYFETEVKFVPSDTLDAGITGGQDATKFAIYAYANEEVEPPTTNLVVYHAYVNGQGGVDYTNYVFSSVNIDASVYTTLRVEMKKLDAGADGLLNVFSVAVNGGDSLSSDLAFDAYLNGNPTGNWFLTVNDLTDADAKVVSSLNFKGTGEIDNIKAGVIEGTTSYAINWTAENATVTNAAGMVLTSTDTNFTAGATLTFTPATDMVITNVLVDGAVVAFDPASYTYTVGAADATVAVYAGTQQSAQTKPAWANDSGDGSQSDPYWAWAADHAAGQTLDAEGADFSAQYLMNIDANKTPVLKIDSIVVTDEGSQIVVSATDGTNAIDLDEINGVLNVLVGDALGSLTKKAIPEANVRFANNVATIIIPAADGKFVKASVDYAAPKNSSLTAVQQN